MDLKKRRKSQAALEYLVTYGWAILAIVIVAAILWYFGIFNPSKYTGSKQSGGSATLSVIDYPTTGTTGVSVKFGNSAGATLNTVNSTIDGVASTCTPDTNIAANAQFSCSTNGASFASGDEVSMTVYYVNALSGIAHADDGFVKAQ